MAGDPFGKRARKKASRKPNRTYNTVNRARRASAVALALARSSIACAAACAVFVPTCVPALADAPSGGADTFWCAVTFIWVFLCPKFIDSRHGLAFFLVMANVMAFFR